MTGGRTSVTGCVPSRYRPPPVEAATEATRHRAAREPVRCRPWSRSAMTTVSPSVTPVPEIWVLVSPLSPTVTLTVSVEPSDPFTVIVLRPPRDVTAAEGTYRTLVAAVGDDGDRRASGRRGPRSADLDHVERHRVGRHAVARRGQRARWRRPRAFAVTPVSASKETLAPAPTFDRGGVGLGEARLHLQLGHPGQDHEPAGRV